MPPSKQQLRLCALVVVQPTVKRGVRTRRLRKDHLAILVGPQDREKTHQTHFQTPTRLHPLDCFLSSFNTNSQPRVHRKPGLGRGQGKQGPLAELEASGQAWEKRAPAPQARVRLSGFHPPSDPTWPELRAPASPTRAQGKLSRQLVGSPPAYLLSGLRARLGPAAARRPGLAAPPRPAPRAAPRAARPRRDPRSPRPRKF